MTSRRNRPSVGDALRELGADFDRELAGAKLEIERRTWAVLLKGLDSVVASYLNEHPDKVPSSTTVLELIEWTGRKAREGR